METLSNVDALVVDPDASSRVRLKQATVAVHQFQSAQLLDTLDKAVKKLEDAAGHIDVVFVSERFKNEEVVSFIQKAKALKTAQDAAFILVMQQSDNAKEHVGQAMVVGADGFLFEPYSVDSLVEITALANKVKKERSEAREKAAIGFLLQDMVGALDKVAYIKSCQVDVSRSLAKLREKCGTFQSFEEETLQMYFDVILAELENAPMPKPPAGLNYRGASERVKKIVADKIQKEIENS